MSTQLTLHTPLQIPVSEIHSYLNQLWINGEDSNKGSNTFSLLVWQPAWIEQQLVNSGAIPGPIIGNERKEIIEAAREIVLTNDLPPSTAPLDQKVVAALESTKSNNKYEDLRGQHVDSSISQLQPRRLITLAPTLNKDNPLETLVAAYCPLPEEGGSSACGDVIVLRGGVKSIANNLKIVEELVPKEFPSWLWWNGAIDENPKLFEMVAIRTRRLVIDTALGQPTKCINLLEKIIKNGQTVSDLNWLRLRAWRETLAMVFDPPNRRNILNELVKIDIDIEGENQVQGLLLIAWIADRLKWKIETTIQEESDGNKIKFIRDDNQIVTFRLNPLPIGNPSIHPGQVIGLRLISKGSTSTQKEVCIILASKPSECKRLEAGGMASMDLIEEVVPLQNNSSEEDVARLLATSRGSTSPLLANAAPFAAKLLGLIQSLENVKN